MKNSFNIAMALTACLVLLCACSVQRQPLKQIKTDKEPKIMRAYGDMQQGGVYLLECESGKYIIFKGEGVCYNNIETVENENELDIVFDAVESEQSQFDVYKIGTKAQTLNLVENGEQVAFVNIFVV